MSHRLFHRSVAFSLATFITLAMLGGIDGLSRKDEQPAGWAQKMDPQTAPRTALQTAQRG